MDGGGCSSLTLNGNKTAIGFHNGFNQRQPQTRSGEVTRMRFIRPVKAREEMRQVFRVSSQTATP